MPRITMLPATAALALASRMVCSQVVAEHPAQVILDVSAFGAVGDGQTDDGPAIRRAIRRAVELHGPVEVRFDRRVYRVGPREDRWCSFDIQDARDITIDGRGATLLLNPHNCGFLIYRSERIVLRNFVIDYDPLPFTQGDVVSLDPENGAFTIRVHEGYPLPESLEADLRQGAFIEPEAPRYTGHWLYVGSAKCISPEERLCRIKVQEGQEERVARAEVGQRFVFGVPSMTEEQRQSRFVIGQEPHNKGVYLSNPAGTIQLMLSRDCLVESVGHYASTGMVYRLTGTENVRLRHIRIIRKPGTDRLVASLSDGMHCKNNKIGPFIEHCTFEALLDDSINLSTMSDDIMERLGPNRFLTVYSDIAWYDTPIAAGDTVLVFDPARAAVLGESRVTEVEFVSSHQRRVTLDRAPEGVVDAKSVGRERATRLFIKKVQGAEVRDCVFRSQMKTAAVFRTPGVFEGNWVEDCFFGVHSHNAPDWGEGPIPYDLTIRGNTFQRVGFAAIAALRIGQGPVRPAGGPIRIEGNTFLQDNGYAIRMENLDDVRIESNAIRMRADTPDEYAAIQLTNCAGVSISGNRISDPRMDLADAIRLRDVPQGDAVVEGNLVTE